MQRGRERSRMRALRGDFYNASAAFMTFAGEIVAEIPAGACFRLSQLLRHEAAELT